jgi:hypothetical protein
LSEDEKNFEKRFFIPKYALEKHREKSEMIEVTHTRNPPAEMHHKSVSREISFFIKITKIFCYFFSKKLR